VAVNLASMAGYGSAHDPAAPAASYEFFQQP
jgi:hypothetical protein